VSLHTTHVPLVMYLANLVVLLLGHMNVVLK